MRTRRTVALVAILALLSTAATCQKHPRHDTTQILKGLVAAESALQQGELALYHANKITPPQHAAFVKKFAEVLTLTDDCVAVVQVWQPGQPVPAQFKPLVQSISSLITDVVNVLPVKAELQQQITAVLQAVAGILGMMAGGA